LEHELAENAWHDLLKRMAVNAGRPPVMAVGAIFTGSIVWGPRIDAGNAEVPGVYFVSHDNGKKRQSVFKGLMLGADSIGPSIAPRLYYSAYAWIMFEACKPDMTPLYNSREDRWKSLLPIFEHANIADGETLAFLKERLAEKAWRAIVDLERSDDIRFRYVCAIDDPGGVSTDRGKHDLRFQLGEATRPKRLRELFGEAVLIAEGASKADASDRGAFQAACEKSATWSRIFKRPEDRSQIITSCDLPEIVADCYRIAHAAHTG
jgi:hypothetical protein